MHGRPMAKLTVRQALCMSVVRAFRVAIVRSSTCYAQTNLFSRQSWRRNVTSVFGTVISAFLAVGGGWGEGGGGDGGYSSASAAYAK